MKAKKIVVLVSLSLVCTLGIAGCSGSEDKAVMETGTESESSTLEETSAEEVSAKVDGDAQEESKSKKEDKNQNGITLGEAVDYMVDTSAQYGNILERKALLKGLEEREEEGADGIDMLVIVSRSFGKLPDPEEGRKQTEEVNLDTVPEWAAKDIENLKNVGALKVSDIEEAQNPISIEDLENMVQRVMDLYGN